MKSTLKITTASDDLPTASRSLKNYDWSLLELLN